MDPIASSAPGVGELDATMRLCGDLAAALGVKFSDIMGATSSTQHVSAREHVQALHSMLAVVKYAATNPIEAVAFDRVLHNSDRQVCPCCHELKGDMCYRHGSSVKICKTCGNRFRTLVRQKREVKPGRDALLFTLMKPEVVRPPRPTFHGGKSPEEHPTPAPAAWDTAVQPHTRDVDMRPVSQGRDLGGVGNVSLGEAPAETSLGFADIDLDLVFRYLPDTFDEGADADVLFAEKGGNDGKPPQLVAVPVARREAAGEILLDDTGAGTHLPPGEYMLHFRVEPIAQKLAWLVGAHRLEFGKPGHAPTLCSFDVAPRDMSNPDPWDTPEPRTPILADLVTRFSPSHMATCAFGPVHVTPHSTVGFVVIAEREYKMKRVTTKADLVSVTSQYWVRGVARNAADAVAKQFGALSLKRSPAAGRGR